MSASTPRGSLMSCPATTQIVHGDGTSSNTGYATFMGAYAPGLTCVWQYSTTSSSFVVSASVTTTLLAADVVTIYDGSTVSSPVLGTWSGGNSGTVMSTNSIVLVVFQSNVGQGFGAGFQVTFVQSTPTTATPPCDDSWLV